MKAVLTFLRSRRYLAVIGFSLLQGCSMQQHQLNDLAQTLDNGNASQVLAEVVEREYPERDLAQYKLTLGLLRAVNGDFAGGINELQAAKAEIAQLQALSVSENIGAVTVNETLRSYTSTASERMLLQQLLILSYLMEDDLDGARVEVLQMQELAKSLPDNGLSGLVSSSYYLGGLVYELGDETDNAMISYRQAYQIMQTSKISIPSVLEDSLLVASKQLGLRSEHEKLVKEFGRDVKALDRNQSQLILVYWGGVVSAKQQRYLSVYEPNLGYNISLALPYYADKYVKPTPWRFTVLGQTAETEIFDDVNLLARADLDAESTAIYAAALARVIIKQTALHEVKKNDEDGLATLLLNITSMVSEMADVRSWNMLPASIQVQRVALDAGTYYLQQPTLTQGLSLTNTVPVTDIMPVTGSASVIASSLASEQVPLELINATASIHDDVVDKASETDNGLSLPPSNTTQADSIDSSGIDTTGVDVTIPDAIAMSSSSHLPIVTVGSAPLVLKAGSTALVFYSSAAKKAYYTLSP
ncbi:hypothetical protein FR932_16015 [Moritella marina ATCC 15381]|uniref:Uncharacterized protein n=2 Tax=Moritella marina TaxID=90736 RepID=A0A5J6WST1_MORMI|nr:hypothetical protein [Moritella marina]QFI40318.1 hypothetical protein FR932_16015 [Moritella marina ATCC 15381]